MILHISRMRKNVNRNVYNAGTCNVTGALLKKATIGRIFANNYDSDVSNSQRTGLYQIPLDRHRMFERDHASDRRKWFTLLAHKSQDGSALNPTWSVSGAIIL